MQALLLYHNLRGDQNSEFTQVSHSTTPELSQHIHVHTSARAAPAAPLQKYEGCFNPAWLPSLVTSVAIQESPHMHVAAI